MRKRPLGKTSLEVSELALGTWGLSGEAYGPIPDGEREKVIERALAVGVRTFDTADCYWNGKMEELLGEHAASEADVVLITKVGTRTDVSPKRKDFSAAYLRQAVERSQKRLRRDTIDCVLLHNPSLKAFERQDTIELLNDLRSSGVVRSWGASVGNAEIGRAAIAAGAEVLELAYNAFHQADLDGLAAEIQEKEVGVLARSVLAHGLLCGLWPQSKQFPPADHRSERWTKDELKRRLQQVSALRPAVTTPITSVRAVALRFAQANPRVSSVVLGPRSSLQLDQLVREAGKEPPYFDPVRLQALQNRLTATKVEPALAGAPA